MLSDVTPMKDFIQHTLTPILAALIWGFAFSAQSICGEYVQPFAINAFRGLVAFLVLLAGCLVLKIRPGKTKDLILGGMSSGGALFFAGFVQQIGINMTTAGKSGFITALYIVLVPVAGIFMGKKTGRNVLLAVAAAVVGMYFLCITDSFSLAAGDLYLLACAVGYTAQIIFIDRYTEKVNGIALSASMFLFSGLFSALASVLLEDAHLADYGMCMGGLLYLAVFSSCVGYTLQIIAQKGGNPTKVSLCLSLESVFAVVGGVIVLHESMSGRELLGCLIMACAIVLAQLPEKKKLKNAEE